MSTNYSNLSRLRTIGSINQVFYPTNDEEIQKIYIYAKNNSLIPFPLGGGSNTLIGHCIKYLIISDAKYEKQWEIQDEEQATKERASDSLGMKRLIVSSNTNINYLIRKASKLGLGGLEFLYGIPAHIGGLVYMNAGADNYRISDFLEWVIVVDENGKRILYNKDIDFEYRKSNITGFITQVCLNLNINDYSEDEVVNQKLHQEIITQYINDRKEKQPIHLPNLGCFFKNTASYPAGALIDRVGLKGFSIGGAMVSPLHANFLVNTGNATFEDFFFLINHIQKVILGRYGLKLELEVRLING